MADTVPMLPPDAGTVHRGFVTRWDRLWKGSYHYDAATRNSQAESSPGYTRGFSQLVAGLFQRQPPQIESGDSSLTPAELSGLLHEMTARAAGYGATLIRPVFDGVKWQPSILSPTRFAVEWAHRNPTRITMWDYAADPRAADNERRGLAVIEVWTPNTDGPGMVETSVWQTERGVGGETKLSKQINIQNPPTELVDHPFILSAANDQVPRDVTPYIWGWEDFGPVALWYTSEAVIEGLARLWDQEQDDAEMTRKRVALPAETLGTATVNADGTQNVLARPGFNKHDNILLLSSAMSAQHGPGGGVTPIEFGDDLVQRDRIERRENSLLEMVGINPASIGRNVGGRSEGAASKRADNQMSLNTITAPARAAELVLSAVVTELARLNKTGAGDLVVSVSEGLKENPVESAEVARMLRDAEAASTKTLVRTSHPTWTDDQVTAEVLLMQSQGAAIAPIEF